MSTDLRARNMNFLFCCSWQPSQICCCGCSLQVGSLISSILTLIFVIFSLINSLRYGISWADLIISTLMLVTIIFFIFGSCKNDFNIIYPSIIGLQIFSIIALVVYSIFSILIIIGGTAAAGGAGAGVGIFFAVVIWLFAILQIYLAFVMWSYSKHVGLGNLDLVRGVATNVHQTPNNYSPPLMNNNI